jgi:hypothetical protein
VAADTRRERLARGSSIEPDGRAGFDVVGRSQDSDAIDAFYNHITPHR